MIITAGFGTCDVDIHYEVLPGEESMPLARLSYRKCLCVRCRRGGKRPVVFDQSYIEQLIRDEIDWADVCVGDYDG